MAQPVDEMACSKVTLPLVARIFDPEEVCQRPTIVHQAHSVWIFTNFSEGPGFILQGSEGC
jgi:hypothetical protein